MPFTQHETLYVPSSPSGKQLEKLPPLVFNLKFNPMGAGFYLESGESFMLPEKIYGKQSNLADRIVTASKNRQQNTGVFLTGEKGSGKTLLTKMISRKMQTEGHPTIIVSEPHSGIDLNQFIERVQQPAVILFDEFEKVYKKGETQEQLLTLLDGTVTSKKLYLLTTNVHDKISDYFCNRPGRLHYWIEFKTLENDVVEDYIDQVLINKAHRKGLEQVLSMFESLNFDMLQAIVGEMNMFDETAGQAVKYLNTRPDTKYTERFMFKLLKLGEEIAITQTMEWVQPLHSDTIRVDIKNAPKEDITKLNEEEEDDWEDEEAERDTKRFLFFTVGELKSADAKQGKYVYVKDDYTLILTKAPERTWNWDRREEYLTV